MRKLETFRGGGLEFNSLEEAEALHLEIPFFRRGSSDSIISDKWGESSRPR